MWKFYVPKLNVDDLRKEMLLKCEKKAQIFYFTIVSSKTVA